MDLNKNKEIWVFNEIVNGKPISVYHELLWKAKEIANAMGNTSVCSILLGHEVEDTVKMLENTGTDIVYVVDHPKLSRYDSGNFAFIFEKMINDFKPEIVLIGATAIGSELAPTIAAKVKTGLAAHCIDIKLDGERVNCMVPAFGGKVISEIYIPETKPIMASVRPGIIDSSELVVNENVKTIVVDNIILDDFESQEVFVSFVPNIATGKKIENAEIVVCAGRGVSTESTWEHLQQLAEKLDAAIGYSRSFVDLGRVEDETNMIGTSGKCVRPKLLLGFGISGASHFVCGMDKSDLIININRDEKAKIFDYSDYGVVGDADNILCALLSKFDS